MNIRYPIYEGVYRILTKQDSREFIMIHGCLVIISCLKKVTGDK